MEELYELALFAGAGGGLLASKWLLGWKTVCYVEQAAYPVAVIEARIRDGLLDKAPIWNDARTFDGKPWAGLVDVITAGFPCQPFALGGKNLSEADERNMWPETIRIIREIRPRYILLENSTGILRGYFGIVLKDLAVSGYDAGWDCVSAASIGAPHKRERTFVVAYPRMERRPKFLRRHIQYSYPAYREWKSSTPLVSVWDRIPQLEKRLGEPCVFGIDDGLAHRVDRLKAIGNGQVPAVVRAAWENLKP